MREKIPIHRINLLVIDDEHKKNLSALTEFEGQRVTSKKDSLLRIVDFPSGEKYVIFMVVDFLDYSVKSFANSIVQWNCYCNGKVYTIILHAHITSEEDLNKVNKQFEQIQKAIVETGTKRIIPEFDDTIYQLVDGKGEPK